MRSAVRFATALLVGASAGCALVAGIEDFHGIAPDAGDESGALSSGVDAVGLLEDATSGDTDAAGDALASDGQPAGDADATMVDAPNDAPTKSCAVACAPTQTCVQGTCYPQSIATGRNGPSTIVVVGGAVDWVETDVVGGSIFSCPVTGCPAAPNTVATGLHSAILRRASPAGMPTLVEVDQGAATARAITSANTLTPLGTDDHVVGAAAAPAGVLWGSRDKVRFCAGSCPTSSDVLAQNKIPPTGSAMELFGARAFWTPPDAGVVSCDVPSCGGFAAAFGASTVIDFEADSKAIVALTSTQLRFADAAGTAGASLALANGVAMVMDAITVYVAAPNAIYAVNRANPTLVTRWPAANPAGLAMDSAFLYWTESDSVLRAPK